MTRCLIEFTVKGQKAEIWFYVYQLFCEFFWFLGPFKIGQSEVCAIQNQKMFAGTPTSLHGPTQGVKL